ncbi:unnamed protein product [Ceutorhynchus assimilis]|nr:unnamed protein product [Ceutorhynchus assimilis]
MPRSRKRHHSRSRSKTRSRSHSPPERVPDKIKKPISNEKDGKRRRLDEAVDSPLQKRSVSENLKARFWSLAGADDLPTMLGLTSLTKHIFSSSDLDTIQRVEDVQEPATTSSEEPEASSRNLTQNDNEKAMEVDTSVEVVGNDKEGKSISESDIVDDKKDKLMSTPKKGLTPRQLEKLLESEKKKQQKIREREEREKQKQDEKAKILAEKQKLKEQKEAERQKILEEKQKQLELKQKEKEQKEEQKRKEREEKEEQKKREREEKELKRKEKEELEKKIEEKNKEKQQKSVALFVNFFKKSEPEGKENKSETTNYSNFMPFAVKSDMRLPPARRNPLSIEDKHKLDLALENKTENILYLQELKNGKICIGKSTKTWPYEDSTDEVMIVEEDKALGEKICDTTSEVRKMKAKFLHFVENRRPAYFGTWRKNSKFIKPRKPFEQDTEYFNYEEDSDDDWEEEEQGESLDISGDEEEKDTENDENDYEIDNDLFVPHGHLSDDEIDDEEGARLSPESLKQKLKLLKDEFDVDIKSKTHKLKPRSVGAVWMNKQGDNIDGPIYRYLSPFLDIFDEAKRIIKRSEIFASPTEKKKVKLSELPAEHIPHFLKIIHGNVNKKIKVVEEFLTFMTNSGHNVDVSKACLTRFIKKSAQYKRGAADGPMKNKFGWFVKDDVKEKYNVNLD